MVVSELEFGRKLLKAWFQERFIAGADPGGGSNEFDPETYFGIFIFGFSAYLESPMPISASAPLCRCW